MRVTHFCNINLIQKCVGIVLLTQCFYVYSEPVWQEYKNKQGVSVHYQSHSDNTFEVKGEVDVEHVSAKDFLELLSDTNVAPHWVENVSKVRVIKTLSPSENIVYSYFDSPWPIANRDVVTYSCYSQLTPQQSLLIVKAYLNELPLYKNVVRIETLTAHWLLTQHNGSLNIVYQVYALPGGIIPTWVNNKVGLNSVFKTLFNLRDMLAHKKYQAKEPVIEAGACLSTE
ncbi:START domain-containing protein [Pseudoalteromonas sp.]|uniref:START domain-containing protein n=1 Tax=Pseudoalteromonas sp. TaxID=53249 RepID=UPI002352C1A4|nr:START domain-containing protein [Pseudoalteromonas sp.]